MSRKKSTIDDLFPKRLKALIENKLMITQLKFSKKIGISQSYLSAVLKNKRGASAELMTGLYMHYREYLYWLLTGKDEIPDKDLELDKNPEISELLEGARRVLTSGNQVAVDALERNIRHYDHAIKTEKRLKEMESEISIMKSQLSGTVQEDRSKGERREEDVEFGGPEKRSGKDRRSAVNE